MAVLPKLLIVDDHSESREKLAQYFESENFQVETAENAKTAKRALKEHQPCIIIIDIKTGDDDPLTLTQELRSETEAGILFVADRTQEINRIIGYELGADYYLQRPVNSRELLAICRNLSRRVAHLTKGWDGQERRKRTVKHFDGWQLDLDSHQLFDVDNTQVPLTAAEFRLLKVLVLNSGRVMSRNELLDIITDKERHGDDRTIDVLVARLRRKLSRGSDQPDLIVTVRGSGYMLVAE